jgi:ABC-type dipeptide/oligopeptide/nickel transport system permease subunit
MKPDRFTPNQQAWRRFRRQPVALASAGLLGVLGLAALAGPALWPYAPDAISDLQFGPPGFAHWFGTDVHGRDLLARVLAGARVSLLVGALGAGVSLVIGVMWGALAGYVGGRLDSLMMRAVDILYSLPSIVFVIVLLTALNGVLERAEARGLSGGTCQRLQWLGLFVGLGAVSWLTMARIVRGQVLSLRQRPFVEASLALGASHLRVLWGHILPNVSGVVIVYLALTVPAVVLYESFLSYLGLGIQPPQASLGSLIAEGATQINALRTYWWLIVFPAAALTTALLALNFVGDGLREAFDPRAGRGG